MTELGGDLLQVLSSPKPTALGADKEFAKAETEVGMYQRISERKELQHAASKV